MPAQLSTTSRRPNRSRARPIAASTSSARVTSHCTAAASPPAPRMRPTVSRAPLSSTSAATTVAPRSARRSAAARPIPEAAPVTSPTRALKVMASMIDETGGLPLGDFGREVEQAPASTGECPEEGPALDVAPLAAALGSPGGDQRLGRAVHLLDGRVLAEQGLGRLPPAPNPGRGRPRLRGAPGLRRASRSGLAPGGHAGYFSSGRLFHDVTAQGPAGRIGSA